MTAATPRVAVQAAITVFAAWARLAGLAGLAGWVGLAGLASYPTPAAAASPTRDCRITGVRHQVQCGTVSRALDPARPDGPRLDIHYVVVPAIARRKLPDPVFVLAGGPGQSAIDVAPTLLAVLNRLGNRRDVVFVDQRGTGRSAPLPCPGSREEETAAQGDVDRQVALMMRCRDALQKTPHGASPGALGFFTTTLAMQDLDAVRQLLGAERINLVGLSYGTRAALEYQRQFPARVRRSVLDGVAPPDMRLPAAQAPDSSAALAALFAACEAEPACARRHPTLSADWAALLRSLPRTVSVADPLTGRSETLTLTAHMLVSAARAPLYRPELAAALPAALAEAAQGRLSALVGLGSLLSSRRGGEVAMGQHFSIVCAEDLPLIERDAAAAATRVAEPDGFLRLYQRVCAQWPRGAVPSAFYDVKPGASAVLLLSGGLDPATPPRHGERMARALGPLARHVVVPHAGHGVLQIGCLHEVVHRFIDAEQDREALAVDAHCARHIPRPPAFQPVAPSPQAAG